MNTLKLKLPKAAENIGFLAIFLVANVTASGVMAQDKIYRCAGNEYTNNGQEAAQRGCKVVEGGNLTVVSSTPVRSANPTPPVRVASASPVGSRIDTPEQRGRDNDSRAILQSELKKSENKLAELLKEYNNGEPEKRGSELRNNQMYLDRVADIKAQIARLESDISGIKREIGRVQP